MISSLKGMQEELLKNERLAVTGHLAASVAHEIRNPLTAMRMTVDLLLGQEKETKRKEALAVVLREIDRLALTVEELLDFARPRPPSFQPTDLNALLTNLLAFLDRQIKHAKVELHFLPAADLSSPLLLDPQKTRQILVNIFLNALQAMAKGGTLTVRTYRDEGVQRAGIEIRDSGPGIPQEIRAKVFEPFVSTKPGGGGLGLAVAKRMIEEQGGKIEFETSNHGTAFFLTFPLDRKNA
jgi:two-component system sensor histidine kinase AtoS